MSIEVLDWDFIADNFLVVGSNRLKQEIASWCKKLSMNADAIFKSNEKLKKICSVPFINDKDIQKPLTGYPKNWYECRLFGQTYGGDFRLVYIKFKSDSLNGWKVRLVGIYTHKEIKNKTPLKSKYNIGEDLSESDLKFFNYLMR